MRTAPNFLTRRVGVLIVALAFSFTAMAERAAAFSANKVWFEFRPGGQYRVYVNYTVPEIKEFREAYVDFAHKKDAERFYFDLLRGADFYPPDPAKHEFVNQPMQPDPW